MPAFIAVGRVLFSVLFIVAGATKLLNLAATAQNTAKIIFPAVLAPYTAQLETMTGMPLPQILAILAGTLELICGLMIALNFGARFFAVLLILFVAAVTFYFHDFWNQTGANFTESVIHALKNLSIIGALFMIIGLGRAGKVREPAYDV